MDTNRKIAEKFTKKLPRSLIVKLLVENISIERLGFSMSGRPKKLPCGFFMTIIQGLRAKTCALRALG